MDTEYEQNDDIISDISGAVNVNSIQWLLLWRVKYDWFARSYRISKARK